MKNPFVPVYSELSDEQKDKMKAIKDKAMSLYEEICTAFDSNPEYIKWAKKDLESSVMWAVKGVTNPPQPQKPESPGEA